MRLNFRQAAFEQRDEPLGRRALSLVLVLVVHALLLFMLLRLAPPASLPRIFGNGLTVIQLSPEDRMDSTRARAAAQKRAASERASPKAALKTAPATSPVEASSPSDIWKRIMPLTREQFADGDIGRMPARQAEANVGEQSANAGDAGKDGADAKRGGGGPNGERLYDADWFRKPTDAELATYMPSGRSTIGWGMIACQTIPENRVDNCQEIGQEPAGSGLARAVRLASWQFRVRPPRIGGRPIIGAWVRIRIDYTPAEGARVAGG